MEHTELMTREELIEKYALPLHAILDAVMEKSMKALTYVSLFSEYYPPSSKLLETLSSTIPPARLPALPPSTSLARSPARPSTNSVARLPTISPARSPALFSVISRVPIMPVRPASSPEKCQFKVCPTIVEDDEPMVEPTGRERITSANFPRTFATVSTSALTRILQPTMASAAKATHRPASKPTNKTTKSYETASNTIRLLSSREGVGFKPAVSMLPSSLDGNSHVTDHHGLRTGMRIKPVNESAGAKIARAYSVSTTGNTRRPSSHTMPISNAKSHLPNVKGATANTWGSNSIAAIPKVYLHATNAETSTKRKIATITWGSNSTGPIPRAYLRTTDAETSAKTNMCDSSERTGPIAKAHLHTMNAEASAKRRAATNIYDSSKRAGPIAKKVNTPDVVAANTRETSGRTGRVSIAKVTNGASVKTRESSGRAEPTVNKKRDTRLSSVTHTAISMHLSGKIVATRAKEKALNVTVTANTQGPKTNVLETPKTRVSVSNTKVNVAPQGYVEHTGLIGNKRVNERDVTGTAVIAHNPKDSGGNLNGEVKVHIPNATGAADINEHSNNKIVDTAVLGVTGELRNPKIKVPNGTKYKGSQGPYKCTAQGRHTPNVRSAGPIKRHISIEAAPAKRQASGILTKLVDVQSEAHKIHPKLSQNTSDCAQTGHISSAHTVPAIPRVHEHTNHLGLNTDEVTCEINSSYVETWAHTSELEAIAIKQQYVDISRAFKDIPPVNLNQLFQTDLVHKY